MSDRECYEVFRRQIQEEDLLFNQRITWVIALQALLFVPYSLLTSQDKKPLELDFLRNSFALLGILTVGLASISCMAAQLRISKLTSEYKAIPREDPNLVLPSIVSTHGIHALGSLASQGSLLLFWFFWTTRLWPKGNPIDIGSVFLVFAVIASSVVVQCWNRK